MHEYELLAGLIAKQENMVNFDVNNYMTNFENYSSWGDYVGLSFEELVALVTDDTILDLIEETNDYNKFERILFPRFGNCLKAVNYSTSYFNLYLYEAIFSDIIIYITDESRRTVHGPDLFSQTGIDINTLESL